jgi:hypothetical protein
MTDETPKDEIESTRKISYDEIITRHPEFEGVISRKNWEFIGHSDKRTVNFLKEVWAKNIEKNVKNGLWDKHGPARKDCLGLGKNKAVIGVGAGPGFNKNKHILKRVHDIDATRDFKERDFIIMASNHMFKPLLKMGIIPDFVVVADASDVVMEQLCKDVPDNGRNCILLATPQASPKVLKRWAKQGRPIRFYLTQSEGLPEAFYEATKDDPKKYMILQGGNVINSAWSISMMVFRSTVFMAIGNDLSFPLKKELEDKRQAYYCDKDYRSNAPVTGTGRDEANTQKKWMGFKLKRAAIWTPNEKPLYNIEIEPVWTTHTLWVYKTWLEANVMGGINAKLSYHYYNCTESGIVGVMCKDDSDEGLDDQNNWFMLDDVCKRYHTRMFEDAVKEFRTAKESMKWGPARAIGRGVPPAIGWAATV